jgi:hypothetical protein
VVSTRRSKFRRQTTLEAQGAEFLVLGLLLAEGIEAHKTYGRYPGYDIVALSQDHRRVCTIQVKSRFQTGARGFLIQRFDCDIVVLVCLNRGFARPRRDGRTGRGSPTVYVFPVELVRKAHRPEGWGKVRLADLHAPESYIERWDLVRRHLDA